jgi:hypothetical protein
MRRNIATLLVFIIFILTISLLASGGCDFNFGGGGGNGGGNGNSVSSSILGTIMPPNNSGITVRVVDFKNQTIFKSQNPTGSSGDFTVQGDFNGCLSLRLEFLDESQTPPNDLLAFTGVTVFPDAQVDLGNIDIANGNVTLEDPVSVTFEGDINFSDFPSTCSGGVGTSEGAIVVTKGNTDVTVQIDNSTTIVNDNGDDFGCDDLFGGEKVEVTGDLQVCDTVLATLIRLK